MLIHIRNAQDVLSTSFVFALGVWGVGMVNDL